ncbi:VOC family protein [Nocardioides sp. J2M5]|uniref:VOC family protein n=1 Tax=Nocardioides palaemonis TaxID=2829810 RepID=UPI001BA48B9D|nr:VOC family protein [Nocardioides palaemonis]MBS2937830.1 VOC family protein [Nocardioides palaemonis]
MTSVHHTIDYVEINVSDLAASRAFYEQAFGWLFNDYGPTYAGIRAASGDGEVGGLNAAGTPGPGGPLVMLFSDDLDATRAGIEAAGGTITTPPHEFPGGRRLEFADPSGNVLGVWASS